MTMETQTLTLTEFLLARIAEDAAAVAQRRRLWPDSVEAEGLDYALRFDSPEAMARAERECAAKRRIVGTIVLAGDGSAPEYARGLCEGLEVARRALAAVYADHPDYQPEWRAVLARLP